MLRKLNLPILALICLLAVVSGLLLKARFGGDWYEFAGFVTGIVAVYLVAVEHVINWPIGLLNVSIYGCVFYQSRLYADMTLQAFFFVLGVLGWLSWVRGGEGKTELQISRISMIDWAKIALVVGAGTAAYVPVITHFKGASPFMDSLLTVTSIVAQVLLNRKKLENWILWIAVDACYIWLYIDRKLIATAVLYSLFLVLAVYGLIGWAKTHRQLRLAESVS